MKLHLSLLLAIILMACNSTPGKKDRRQKDDTTGKPIPTEVQVLKPVKGTPSDIPAGLSIKGTVQEVWKWTDQMGANLLVTSVLPPYDDTQKNEYGEEGQSASLHAYHFTGENGAYSLLWSLTDGEKICPFDITCDFIKDAVTVTDLDADQVAETTVQYKLACRSDVSPSAKKLIMHEGKDKYALRGLMWLSLSPEHTCTVTYENANLETLAGYKKTDEEFEKTFGRYESEKDFGGAPEEFITHARLQWIKFVKESFE